MSRATLYVQFPDGTVRYGLYNGTIDRPCAQLYDTAADAWHGYDLDTDPSDGVGFPVRIATDYGHGSSWAGTATKDRLTTADPDAFADYDDGLPKWVR